MTPPDFESWLASPTRRRLVMGVLNVTPDSFSDGGQFTNVATAVEHSLTMLQEGADLIDIGGESTRPGSNPTPVDQQIARVVPVIRALRERTDATLSIDTGMAQVAEAALAAGAHVINDIYAGTQDSGLFAVAAQHRAPIILMHMQGRPATMQQQPRYTDVVAEVIAFLKARIDAAAEAGISTGRVLIDPGIGFGKTAEHNLILLRKLSELETIGRPIVVGVSRKRFIGSITGESVDSGRPFGTAAAVAWSAAHGADVLRVHDVGAMSQVVRTIEAIQPKDHSGFSKPA